MNQKSFQKLTKTQNPEPKRSKNHIRVNTHTCTHSYTHSPLYTYTCIHTRSYYIPTTERKIREKILKAEKNTYSRTKKIFTIFLIETIGIKSVQSKKICQSRIVLFDKNIFRKEWRQRDIFRQTKTDWIHS